MDRHVEAVAEIASGVRRFYNDKEHFRIYHGSTNSTRSLLFSQNKIIDTSQLSKVLHVDADAMTVLVEPNVPMDRFVEATLAYGLMPPVVMEFPGITVGGGFAGTAGESSSFKHGLFDRTVTWIEIVLADGEVVTASDTVRSDLFHGAAGTFGTLGVLTLLKVRLVPAKTYVELTYVPISSVSEAIQEIGNNAADSCNDFLDGILFARDSGVIVKGRLTNVVPDGVKVQRFSRARDQWFYLHVRSMLSPPPTKAESSVTETKSPTSKAKIFSTEVVPLVDYLFRYDRGGFWVGYYAFKYFVTPFNRFTRWALDRFMHTRVMYHALHESGHAERYIIQDLCLPYASAEGFIEYVDQQLGFYPIWICPLRMEAGRHMPLHPRISTTTSNGNMMNVGLWGPGPKSPKEFIKLNREIEQTVQKLSGVKWLYARAYYTEEEFWKIYDHDWYSALRKRYCATSMPSVYDKVKVDLTVQHKAMVGIYRFWPLSGLRGVAKAMLSSDYVLASGRSTNPIIRLIVLLLSLLVTIMSRLSSTYRIIRRST